jgi:hypothetical protein
MQGSSFSQVTGTDAESATSDPPSTAAVPRTRNIRAQRVRAMMGSYNENILSGTAKKLSARRAVTTGSQIVPRGSLLPNGYDKHRQVVRDNIGVADTEWTMNSVTLDSTKKRVSGNSASKRRQSTRLNLLERATGLVNRSNSVSGKRDRDLIEAGREKIEGSDRRVSLKRSSAHQMSGGPPEKKTKLIHCNTTKLEVQTDVQDAPKGGSKRNPRAQTKVKRWLTQGLYVGQERDFNPKLTETKNNVKRVSKGSRFTEKHPAFPMPMFAGQRLIEMGRDFKLPYHVFSPLPPGQPKPEEWKKTHKSE